MVHKWFFHSIYDHSFSSLLYNWWNVIHINSHSQANPNKDKQGIFKLSESFLLWSSVCVCVYAILLISRQKESDSEEVRVLGLSPLSFSAYNHESRSERHQNLNVHFSETMKSDPNITTIVKDCHISMNYSILLSFFSQTTLILNVTIDFFN